MHKRIISIGLLLAIGASVTAYAISAARPDRSDCPGKIVCPLTGELICKDRCPLGEQGDTDQTMELPPCCRQS